MFNLLCLNPASIPTCWHPFPLLQCDTRLMCSKREARKEKINKKKRNTKKSEKKQTKLTKNIKYIHNKYTHKQSVYTHTHTQRVYKYFKCSLQFAHKSQKIIFNCFGLHSICINIFFHVLRKQQTQIKIKIKNKKKSIKNKKKKQNIWK